jgi:hypothetical protein
MHRDKFLIIKPTKCTNFSILFSNETTCFGQLLCPSSGVFHCTHSNGIRHTGLRTACKQDQDGTSSIFKFILFWNNTLHVSDGLSDHHQESKTVHTASGIHHTGSVAAC